MLGAIQILGEPCQSQFNAGFLTHLYAIATDDLVYTYPPSGSSINQPMQAVGVLPGSIITEFTLKPKTATFNESSSETEAGFTYAMSLSLSMKGTAADLTNWIHVNAKRRFILLTRDTLGNCYMIGAFGNGARMSWSRQVATTSLHQLTFSLIHWHPIQFIPTIDLELILPDREFDYSFDLSFS